MKYEWVRQSNPPNPLCRGGWGGWIYALIPHSSYSLNESEMIQQHWIKWHYIIWHSFSISDDIRMSATIDSPQPPLQRGLGGVNWRTHSILNLLTEWEWNDALTMERMTIKLLNEKRMWDIFEWPRFFIPIPGSFLHFWWEKMRKIRSRLQGIRKLSLWTEWTQF